MRRRRRRRNGPSTGSALAADVGTGEPPADTGGLGQEQLADPAPVPEREYDCCAVQRVRGWLGGTAVVTVVHRAGCPVWSAR